MFVVDIWEDGNRLKPKVFSVLPTANTFAGSEIEEGRTAKVYEVLVEDNPYDAIAALERGEAKLVAAPQHKATAEEVARAAKERAELLKPTVTRELIEDRVLGSPKIRRWRTENNGCFGSVGSLGERVMPITFANILESAGIDPREVHLARHADTRVRGKSPYTLWRSDLAGFELYQRIQRRPVFRVGNLVASFVVPPTGETLFVGCYRVAGVGTVPSGMEDPLVDIDVTGLRLYDLQPNNHLAEYKGRLIIDWGGGARTWCQKAASNVKNVLELRANLRDESFPGYMKLVGRLSDVTSFYTSWIVRLREAKGIYLISCPKTREHYVGKASGEGGFYERWLQHAAVGGDALGFKRRDPSDYQVTILEVSGSSATEDDISAAEQRWIRKLQSTAMGLNGSAGARGAKSAIVSQLEIQ
jgi:hypothetical protein